MADKLKLAFLGPEGTYTHQAAFDKFGDRAVYSERNTIADVFHALSEDVSLAVIPRENSIFGPVAETFDVLRSCVPENTHFIREELTLQIRHSLVIRKGVALQDIRRVLSHEQALGQCSSYLKRHLPHATLEKVSSTAAAARAVLAEDPTSSCSAAICSKICVQLYDGLEALEEGIQNKSDNFTRFWLFSFRADSPLPIPCRGKFRDHRALLRLSRPINCEPDGECVDEPARMIKALISPTVQVNTHPFQPVDSSRPVHFVEIGERASDQEHTADGELWLDRVRQNVKIALSFHHDVVTLGVWLV